MSARSNRIVDRTECKSYLQREREERDKQNSRAETTEEKTTTASFSAVRLSSESSEKLHSQRLSECPASNVDTKCRYQV